MSPADAEVKDRKQLDMIRKGISQGKFKENKDCKKFGKQRVMTVTVLEREYGGK